MKIIHDVEELSQIVSQWKKEGKTVGFVPTMGFLHEGHLQLFRQAVKIADKTVVSIFVNPRQFGADEDLDNYPRDIERDSALTESNGVDTLFFPDKDIIYPKGYQTNISLPKLAKGLCGKSRPIHFDGVATIVTKLFNMVQPDYAVFGKKDYQQFVIIKQLVLDLNLNIEVIGYPIVREDDGLAMSSRNNYLNKIQRDNAVCLFNSLQHAKSRVADEGKIETEELIKDMRQLILGAVDCRVDYIEIVDSTTLQPVLFAESGVTIALAVYFGEKIRLIDNIQL